MDVWTLDLQTVWCARMSGDILNDMDVGTTMCGDTQARTKREGERNEVAVKSLSQVCPLQKKSSDCV